MKKKNVYVMAVIIFLLTFVNSEIFAQQSVSGTVVDDSGEPVVGATVIVKGTTNGTITDIDGQYSISNVGSDDVLVFSFVGYKSVETALNGRSIVDVSLELDLEQLEEVVVVGYGAQVQQKVTGSIQQVDAQQLQDLPAAQVTQKLQGRLAGVQISQTTGKPGQGMQVRVRGQVSLSAGSEPLYVVDGQPIVGDISTINPNEIESISILKDAASTSLYGSRAANGVVLVTTKRGSREPGTSISVNMYTGFQQIPEKGFPEVMNGEEWATFMQERAIDAGDPVPDQFQNPSQYGEGTDWFREITRNAPINDLSVSLSSTKENFRTSAVAGYFNQQGVMLNSGFERFSLRVNSDFQINERMKAGFNVAPTYTVDNIPASDGAFYSNFGAPTNPGGILNNALLTPPILSPTDANGNSLEIVGQPPLTTFTFPNWVTSTEKIQNETQRTRILANGFFEAEPIDGLVLKTSLNFDLGSRNRDFFQPSEASVSPFIPPGTSSGIYERENFSSWLNENIITYSKDINDHSFEILGGYTVQKYKLEGIQVSAQNFSDDRVPTLQSAVNINQGQTNTNIQEWSLISYLSRLNYSFKNKYLFTASIRRDGSSRFGSDNRWGNFPSVSAGWVLSEESFFDVNLISFAKLRASYGVTGNNNIGNYTQFGAVSTTAGAVFGSTIVNGATATTLSNPGLGWERSSQLDIGLELAFFDDKISFSYDYYNKTTTDLLYTLPVAPASGFTGFTGNVGEIKFWGHEFLVNARHKIGQLDISAGANLTFNRNEVTELADGVPFIIAGNGNLQLFSTITQVGQPVAQFYGMIWDGVYDNQEEFNNNPVGSFSEVGTIRYRDVNGNGQIDVPGGAPGDDDRTIIGNPFPDFIYGVNATLRYRGFDFSVVGSGSQGNDIMRMSDQGLTNLDGVFNVLKEVEDRWRSEANPGSGRYGKTTAQTGPERDFGSTRFLQDGSFFTIKNITLGYSLPQGVIKGVKTLRVYSSIQQAFVFTNYTGANPEVGTNSNGGQPNVFSQGADWSSFPVPRTITFGVNIGL